MIDNLIVGGRGTGKTTELIRIAAAEGRYIVVPNERMKRCVAKQAKDMGLNMLYPVAFEELPFHRRFVGEVLVDEAQMILEKVIGAHINTMAVCAERSAFINCIPEGADWKKLEIEGAE